MKTLSLFALLLFVNPGGLNPRQQSFDAFSKQFVMGYKKLHLPEFSLGYMQNLKSIQSLDSVTWQRVFFEGMRLKLWEYDPQQLSVQQKQDYEQIAYEINLNIERTKLERDWLLLPQHLITDNGLYKTPLGKRWYAYFLKKWLSADVRPDEIYQFGLNELERVKGHINQIQQQSGMDKSAFYKYLNSPAFFINDKDSVQQAFEHTKAVIYAHMGELFSTQSIPQLAIKPGANQALAQTPGYYSDNTFYYNLFDKPYNKRQYDWLFIHEAVPGHHYMESINERVPKSEIQSLFHYLGLSEGWAAYTEELGKQLGVYKTPYDELGKWQWDMVRSVRVPMEVGLNYYGWTDAEALAFWKKNITGQDDIALREIARVKRWPAQSVTYKYGAVQIMEWKAILQRQQGNKFNIRDFHDKILLRGSLPVFMVKENVLKSPL